MLYHVHGPQKTTPPDSHIWTYTSLIIILQIDQRHLFAASQLLFVHFSGGIIHKNLNKQSVDEPGKDKIEGRLEKINHN